MNEFDILALLLLVAGSFAVTNVDNLVLMVVLLGAQPESKASVTLGFIIGAISVLCVAALGAVLGANLDPGIVGYMGFAPILMGFYLFYRRWRPPLTDTQDSGTARQVSGILATSVLMFSNSADSIAVFFPLLAESSGESLLWVVSAFLIMVLLWAALAWQVSEQPALARRIESMGEKLVPWIMIMAGTYILLDTGTDTLL